MDIVGFRGRRSNGGSLTAPRSRLTQSLVLTDRVVSGGLHDEFEFANAVRAADGDEGGDGGARNTGSKEEAADLTHVNLDWGQLGGKKGCSQLGTD